ncbi:guanylate kinase [Bacillus mojavensis]
MGKLYLITAPSGCGKTTVARKLAEKGVWKEIVSTTTRKMRNGEEEGRDYYFIDSKKFITMRDNREFAEAVTYGNNFYGIENGAIERALSEGDAYAIVEYQGFRQIRKKYPDSVGIFIWMEKNYCLANMLLRGDTIEQALNRIAKYDDEMLNWTEYDYSVKNAHGEMDKTIEFIENIVKTESAQ